jgi:hypothetical protein
VAKNPVNPFWWQNNPVNPFWWQNNQVNLFSGKKSSKTVLVAKIQ